MSSIAAVTSSAVSTVSSAAGGTCSSDLEWNLSDSLFLGSRRILFSVRLVGQTHANLVVFVKVLEECNPVILVLVLTLVLVWGPSAGARGSKKLVLLAYLLSIRLLQNYEHSIILE